jgi:hypothetical protein
LSIKKLKYELPASIVNRGQFTVAVSFPERKLKPLHSRIERLELEQVV